MKFRTEYEAGGGYSPSGSGGSRTSVKGDTVISLRQGVTLLGSCFAENICGKMRESFWDALNPFGVLFNPLSIANAIELALDLKEKHVEDRIRRSIFREGEICHSWLFDSHFSALSAEEVEEKIYCALKEFYSRIKRGDTLIITFGTARCYYHKNMFGLVANCHKQPQTQFECRRVVPDMIKRQWITLTHRLREINPDIRIIFTVSPVRHLKDGFVENARSKATLLLAVEQICAFTGCRYFPAFEIVNDDLRDYRFYASDLVHPSEEAVEYIWEKFKETYLTEGDRKLLREAENLRRRVMHRSIVSGTEAERKFQAETKVLMSKFMEGKSLGFRY